MTGTLTGQQQGLAVAATSGDNAALTVTAPAPGAGKRLHLTGFAYYPSTGNVGGTVTIEQGGSSVAIETHTGVTAAKECTGMDLVADENTAITLDLPAIGAGETTEGALFYYVETI